MVWFFSFSCLSICISSPYRMKSFADPFFILPIALDSTVTGQRFRALPDELIQVFRILTSEGDADRALRRQEQAARERAPSCFLYVPLASSTSHRKAEKAETNITQAAGKAKKNDTSSSLVSSTIEIRTKRFEFLLFQSVSDTFLGRMFFACYRALNKFSRFLHIFSL